VFIALDGAGIERNVHSALWRSAVICVNLLGPGGHSWAAVRRRQSSNAVGKAKSIASPAFPRSTAPRTTHGVVRLGGGTGLNRFLKARGSTWI